MARLLTAFVREQGDRAFVWGESDCLLFLADWVLRAHGVDPGAPWRGTYGSLPEAQALYTQAGGKASLIDAGLTGAGLTWSHTSHPAPGDLGLVNTPTGGLTGAVCLGTRWAFKGDRRAIMRTATATQAWKIHNAPSCRACNPHADIPGDISDHYAADGLFGPHTQRAGAAA